MKMKILKFLVFFCPFSSLRIFLLNCIPEYSVSHGAHIGPFNFFKCNKLNISKDVFINKFNRFDGGDFNVGVNSTLKSKITVNGKGNFTIGSNCVINNDVHFDLACNISICDNVVFGGRGCEVWTHGYDWERSKSVKPVCIGADVYIGSRVIINPGVSICNKVIIGAGTVVAKNIEQEECFVTSNQLVVKHVVALSSRGNSHRHINGEKVFET